MANIIKTHFTHAGRLERWLGKDTVEGISQSMLDWHGKPIAVGNVPGLVYAAKGGEFVGPIDGGWFASAADYAAQKAKRVAMNFGRAQQYKANMGFSSLSDLIAEATTGGKAQQLLYSKVGTTATTVGNAGSLWNVGNTPAAGGVGGTSGTGVKKTRTSTGALAQANPAGGDTQHLTTFIGNATNNNTLLLYDRLWDMTYNHATSTSTAIDSANRPDRYQTANTAPSNFVSGEITTALSATAHTLTVTYVDQDGNAGEAAAAYNAPVSAVVNRTPLVAGNWFLPLNSPDTGARYLTNIAQSTITSVTGVTTWFVGHPISFFPLPGQNVSFILDGINSAFNLVRIYDDACLAFMEPTKATAGATTYQGIVMTCSG